MRLLLIFPLLAFALPTCQNDREEFALAVEPVVSVVLLTDDSLSDLFIRPDTATLRVLLSPYLVGGLELSVVSVKADSYKQTVYYSGLLQVDTLPKSSNFIKSRNNRAENKKRMTQAAALLKPVLDSLQQRFDHTRKCDSSDVDNALFWVNIAASNAVKKSHKVIVILASDLVQDMIHYVQESTHTIQLPPGIQLVVIGHHPSVDLKQLFPGQKPLVLPSFQHLQQL